MLSSMTPDLLAFVGIVIVVVLCGAMYSGVIPHASDGDERPRAGAERADASRNGSGRNVEAG